MRGIAHWVRQQGTIGILPVFTARPRSLQAGSLGYFWACRRIEDQPMHRSSRLNRPFALSPKRDTPFLGLPDAPALIMLAAGLLAITVYARNHILNLARMIPEYLRWLKFWVAEKKARESYETGTMKTKGFTLIELVVACTLLMILSTLATTSVDNLVQAFKNLQATNQTLTNNGKIWTLKFMLARAQLAYAAAPTTDQGALSHWNFLVEQNDTVDLILLIAPNFQIPRITDLPSLLQYANMHDPTGVTPDPTIQLGSFAVTTPGGLSSLPTVTWQGITL
jgi:type II secretory pathway pseudopilin PulG